VFFDFLAFAFGNDPVHFAGLALGVASGRQHVEFVVVVPPEREDEAVEISVLGAADGELLDPQRSSSDRSLVGSYSLTGDANSLPSGVSNALLQSP